MAGDSNPGRGKSTPISSIRADHIFHSGQRQFWRCLQMLAGNLPGAHYWGCTGQSDDHGEYAAHCRAFTGTDDDNHEKFHDVLLPAPDHHEFCI